LLSLEKKGKDGGSVAFGDNRKPSSKE